MKKSLFVLLLLLLPVPLLAQVQNPNVNIRAVGGTAIGTSVPVTLAGTAGSTVGISGCSGATCYTAGFNSGLVAITSGSTTTPTSTTTLVQSIWCNNQTASAVNLYLTDGSNNYYAGPNYQFPSGSNGAILNIPTGVIFSGGIRVSAGTASALKCQFMGQQ